MLFLITSTICGILNKDTYMYIPFSPKKVIFFKTFCFWLKGGETDKNILCLFISLLFCIVDDIYVINVMAHKLVGSGSFGLLLGTLAKDK